MCLELGIFIFTINIPILMPMSLKVVKHMIDELFHRSKNRVPKKEVKLLLVRRSTMKMETPTF
jgi:hypothetical protein